MRELRALGHGRRGSLSRHRIHFELNGVERDLDVAAERLAIELLRDDLALTGTKLGCGIGVCGVCTILVDGAPLSSCLLPAVFLDGARVTTIEGIARDGELSALQEAFITRGGFQCGICTPGQIVAATALLRERPRPMRDEIRAYMKGNLCRCTGYEGIVNAIEDASRM